MLKIVNIKFIYKDEEIILRYPKDCPIPSKDDEITFQGKTGIVEKCSFYVTNYAYEINIIAKSNFPFTK